MKIHYVTRTDTNLTWHVDTSYERCKYYADSTSGVPNVIGTAEIEPEPIATVLGYVVLSNDTIPVSRHRVPRRAMDAARKLNNESYGPSFWAAAMLADGTHRPLVTIRGDIPAAFAPVDSRTYIFRGRQYVICADGHLEPRENRDGDGRLVGWYESAAIKAGKIIG